VNSLPLVSLLCVSLLLPACTTDRSPSQVNSVLQQQARSMAAHLAADEPLAGLRIARGLVPFDPALADFSARLAAAPQEVRAQFEHERLGVNVSLRRDDEAGFWSRAAWWLPDRLLDLCDVVSFDLRLGYGLGVDLHATRAAQLGLGAAGGIGLGWHEQRSLGVRVAQYNGWRLGSAGGGFDWGFDVGTGERHVGGARREGGAQSEDLIYQEWRDYWSLGASAHALLLGVEVDLHPIELADFFGGLVGFDLGHDDQGTTRPEPVFGNSGLALQTLRECLVDEPTMDMWAAARDAAAGMPTEGVSAPGDAGNPEGVSPPADEP